MSDTAAPRPRGSALADFADEVDIEHPLTARRIPVLRGAHSRWKYHVALVIGQRDWQGPGDVGLEPEPFEVDQLCAYLEKHMRYYNARYRAQVEGRGPFDVDGTVNTHTFRKHPEHGWQYNVATWTQGPTWFPTPPWHKVGPFTLEELLDRINTFGAGPPSQLWLAVKAESGAFPTDAERDALASIARRCANPLGIYDEDGYCYWCGNHKGKAGHGYDCPLADVLDPTLTPRRPLPPGGGQR